MGNHTKRTSTLLLAIALLLLASGCAVQPKKLTEAEITKRVEHDLQVIEDYTKPLTGPITLYEAMARALKYNLDYRLEWTKRVLAETELDLSHYEMLPDLVATAGFNQRGNFSGASSRSLLTGQQSLVFSTSEDRDIFHSNLELSWNVLDFGLSYFRAKQAANEVLIAEEEKRKVIHRLLQNVRTAYWRVAAATRLRDRMQAVQQDVEQALAKSEEIAERRLDSPLTALRYRRELIDIDRQLQELEQNFRVAQIQLAALMSVRDPTKVEVIVPQRSAAVAELDHSLAELEKLALRNRPELRQVDYQKRNAELAAHSALIELLPAPRLSISENYNDNSFLFNNNWLLVGAQVSWNLLKLLRYPALVERADAQERVLDARSLTLTMAVLTQVKVSMAEYLLSLKQYHTQQDYQETQSLIDDQVTAMYTSGTIGKQEQIREAMNTLLAEVRYDVAAANLQKAYADVLASAGLDPALKAPEDKSLDELINILKSSWPGIGSHGVAYQAQ